MGRSRGDNIFDVVESGTPDELRALIAAGGKVDAVWTEDKTPLHHAASLGRVDQARVLLDHGAPVDALTKLGGSPLYECAARRESLEMASLLLERGADPDRPSRYHGGPLHAAATHDNVALIELLVRSGAAVDARNPQGWSPLHVAAYQGRLDAVATLLRLGADPFLLAPDGKSAALLTSSARIRELFPADPATEAATREVDAIFATFAELEWFKYVPAKDVERVRAKFRDAYLAHPTLISPFEKGSLRSIDGRSCAADAEEVAEGGAHEVLLLLADSLAHEGVSFSNVESIDVGNGYALLIDDARYEVSSGARHDQSESLDHLVAIVNLLLSRAGSGERLYTVGQGNDAAVILLSPALVSFATTLNISPRLNATR